MRPHLNPYTLEGRMRNDMRGMEILALAGTLRQVIIAFI
jgi:hypothetical protein